MAFCDVQSRDRKELIPGASVKTFWGDKMLLSLFELESDTEMPTHSHPHEQIAVMLEGELEIRIGDERRLLKQGDCFIVPGGVEHSARSGPAPCKIADIFSPVREEYKY